MTSISTPAAASSASTAPATTICPTSSTYSVRTFAYDDRDRLIREESSGPAGDTTVAYTYDRAGNRLTRTTDGVETAYVYDVNDRLLSETTAGQTVTYTYDANGNRTAKITAAGDRIDYAWDSQNRLRRVDVTESGAVTTVRYRYDTSGLRVEAAVAGADTRSFLFVLALRSGQVSA